MRKIISLLTFLSLVLPVVVFGQDQTTQDVQIHRFLLTAGIQHHEPTKLLTHITTVQQRVFAFADLEVPMTMPLTFVWTRNDRVYHEQKITVHPSSHFRTYSYVTAHPGQWMVCLKDAAGKVLGERAFEVKVE